MSLYFNYIYFIMLLSIIIPSFQQSDLLEGALQSIEQQTLKKYEILVIDGGSKDNTAAVVAKFSHLPITFHSEPDAGIYDAMNKGITLSNGQYLYFMGCDDRLASATILAEVFERRNITKSHIIYGDVIFTDNGARYDGEFTQFKLIKKNIGHQAIFTQRVVFEQLGNFDIRYKTYADWEFNMRWFVKSWVKRQYIPLVVAFFDTTGFSANLKDDVFFAEEALLQRKYFSRIVRYLSSNPDRPLHYRTIKLLTSKRLIVVQVVIKSLTKLFGK